MQSGQDIPRWDADYAAFCAQIERVRSPLKIILKTKNDPFFIARWIEHHLKIVGPENLIIFDNMSDDPEVLSVYREYAGKIAIIKFAGRHNDLHHTGTYKALYDALAQSSAYFLFIDTDEYLVLIEDDTYCDGDCIVKFILENRHYPLFPTVWLWNANWNSRQFLCGTEPAYLANNLALGKPLIRADRIPIGYVNHNFQLGNRLFRPPFKSNLFLLHLAYLIPEQRIATNMNKLIARELVRVGESPETIARRSDITEGDAASYVSGIRDCLALAGRKELGNAALGAGCLELLPNGAISYYSDAERKAINELIAHPRSVYALIPNHYRLSVVGA